MEDLEVACLRAAMSDPRIWTGREVLIEDGELVRTYLDEYIDYFGSAADGEVKRRWVLTSCLKNSGQIASTQRMMDRQLDEYFPETDIELPEPPDGVGKSRDELYVEAKMQGVL